MKPVRTYPPDPSPCANLHPPPQRHHTVRPAFDDGLSQREQKRTENVRRASACLGSGSRHGQRDPFPEGHALRSSRELSGAMCAPPSSVAHAKASSLPPASTARASAAHGTCLLRPGPREVRGPEVMPSSGSAWLRAHPCRFAPITDNSAARSFAQPWFIRREVPLAHRHRAIHPHTVFNSDSR